MKSSVKMNIICLKLVILKLDARLVNAQKQRENYEKIYEDFHRKGTIV